MKISTINKGINIFRWVLSILIISLSVVIVGLQIDYILNDGVKKVEVEVEVPVEVIIEKVVEVEKEVIIKKTNPDVVDLQGVIDIIQNKHIRYDERPTFFMITNDCPPFIESTVCFNTIGERPTSNFYEAIKNLR